MSALNEHWRNKPGPTDVLSFPLEEALAGGFAADAGADYRTHRAHLREEIAGRIAREGTLALGDVVIDAPYARRQAKEHGESAEAAYLRLLAHGVAHLLGYDHELGEREEKAMQRVEQGLRRAALRGRG